MESINPYLERHAAFEERIERLTRQDRASLENGVFPADMLEVINARHKAVQDELSVESFEKFRSLIGGLKAAGKSSFLNVSKLLESIKIAFEKSGEHALARARRNLEQATGDLATGATIRHKKLAKKLHVGGTIPKDMKRYTNEAITMARHLRTSTIPDMDRSITRASNIVFGPTPRSSEECSRLTAKLASEAALSKTLIDFYDNQELLAEYPGGIMLCTKFGRGMHIPDNAKVTDKDSLAVQRKLEQINARQVTTVYNPKQFRKKPIDDRVGLLGHDSAVELLAQAERLILEGKALSEMGKIFRGYPAWTVANVLDEMLGEMAGEIIHDQDRDVYYDTQIHIDSDDRTRLAWLKLFYGAGVMQHHVVLPAMATVLYQMAQGYIALVEESISHYR